MTDAALKGIGLLCRTGGLIGHLTEEAERPHRLRDERGGGQGD